jgi:hypothetical protein
MQQRANVTIDDDDNDDDDDDVKQEVTETIEKFVQNRHVQTLKYLRHVIDENRHLRLHIEHLKRRQDDPIESPAIIDPIEPEEAPITEIPIVSSEPEVNSILINRNNHSIFQTPVSDFIDDHHHNQATNTDGEDFEMKYHALNDELINVRKQHNINREEFQRELERVDNKNNQLEKDFKSIQQQLMITEKCEHDKQIEIQKLTGSLTDQKVINEALTLRVNKLEQTNRLLTQALNTSEQTRIELQSQFDGYKQICQETEQKFLDLKIEFNNNEKRLQISDKEIELLKEKVNHQRMKIHELNDDNEELQENVKYLQQQLQEKILQEQQYNREKQLNSNFKDFVQVKRTLQACQNENEQLKIELKKLQIKFLNKNE